MGRQRVIYDPNMKVMALVPEGMKRIDLGRETYGGIPVPMSPRRMKGDGTKIEGLFKHFPDESKKLMLQQLRGISRIHAAVVIEGDEALIEDAGSRNGVTLKGVGIGGADKKLAAGEKAPLKNGAVFALGAWPLQYFDGAADIEKLRKAKPKIYVVAPKGAGPRIGPETRTAK